MPGFNIPNLGLLEGVSSAFQGPEISLETARKHRYRLNILDPFGSDATGILLFLEKCTRPAPEIDEITIHHGQDEIYRPGKNRWGPVEFTFYEKLNNSGIADDTARLIYNWWASTTINLQESIHSAVPGYYKNAELQMLDGVGHPIWIYNLYNCWIQKVTPSSLSYSDSDIATITVTMRFNKAIERNE